MSLTGMPIFQNASCDRLNSNAEVQIPVVNIDESNTVVITSICHDVLLYLKNVYIFNK